MTTHSPFEGMPLCRHGYQFDCEYECQRKRNRRYVCPNQTQFPFQRGHLVKSEWGRIEIVDGKHQWTQLENWCVTCNVQGIEEQ